MNDFWIILAISSKVFPHLQGTSHKPSARLCSSIILTDCWAPLQNMIGKYILGGLWRQILKCYRFSLYLISTFSKDTPNLESFLFVCVIWTCCFTSALQTQFLMSSVDTSPVWNTKIVARKTNIKRNPWLIIFKKNFTSEICFLAGRKCMRSSLAPATDQLLTSAWHCILMNTEANDHSPFLWVPRSAVLM